MQSFFDLSHPLNSGSPVYQGDQHPKLQQLKEFGRDGYNLFELHSSMHVATHLDGPMHMSTSTQTIDTFPAGLFCGEALLIDVAGQAEIVLSPDDCKRITRGSIVLFYTGWDQFYGTEEYYTRHPQLTVEAATFLAKSGVKMVGFDTPSPDRYPFEIHPTLFEKGIFILENLTKLEQLLPIARFELFAFPLKIEADSSWVRVVARTIS